MKTPHKHAEIIKAWADGQDVQINLGDGWEDINYPNWYAQFDYRVKPEPKKYRVALVNMSDNIEYPLIVLSDRINSYTGFIKWLTEEFEVE